jgi:hypothetical protein
MSTQTFHTKFAITGKRTFIALPFDPNKTWGEKERHHVTGTINGIPIRGPLVAEGDDYVLTIGPAWLRDAKLDRDAVLTVTLSPEGPQQDNMAQDVTAALASDVDARAFFESLPTFYRKNYIRWIESAKRPETRATRIAEMLTLLKARKREK